MNNNTPSFKKTNLQNIKGIFKEKTGVELASRYTIRHPARTVAVLVVVLACCFSLTAFTINMFSSMSGDDLGFSATYEKNGIVSIKVENRSDKDLVFQSKLKLMLWSTGEEITPISDDIIFEGTKIAANSSGTMTIDLSNAYDIGVLEKPLTNDNYYFILTNNNFTFGQDWMCTVKFSDTIVTADVPVTPVQADKTILQSISESLQFYFEDITFDIDERRTLNANYVQTYTKLFEKFDGNIVSSVSPFSLLVDIPSDIIFDNSISSKEQHLLIGEHWFSSDAKFKMLATEKETVLTVSALLPSAKYTDADSGTFIPLFYIFMYDKSEINVESDYAFIYGQVISFSDLEQYKIYEDEQYICYEASELIYSDLTEYIQSFVSHVPDIRYDKQAEKRVENIYNYYKKNLSSSFITR